MQDMGRNFLSKFIEICMEMPCGAHLDRKWKPIGTSVTEFCYKSTILSLKGLGNIKRILFLVQELLR